MIDLARQQGLPLFGLLAVRYIDGHTANPHDFAGNNSGCRRADAPAQLAARPQNAELSLQGLGVLVHLPPSLAQMVPVFRMNERPDVSDRDGKVVRVDAENPVLAFVPR